MPIPGCQGCGAPARRKDGSPTQCPRFDAPSGRVVEGYGVLQPRVAPHCRSSRGSVFQRLFSSASGIDPYSSAVSDVYQDLCGEGSYVGKGIYDVDAFEAALAGRVQRTRCLATTCSKDLCPGGPRLGCRGHRRISVALRRGRRSRTPVGTRRLAIAAVGIRPRCAGEDRRHRRFHCSAVEDVDNLRRTLWRRPACSR